MRLAALAPAPRLEALMKRPKGKGSPSEFRVVCCYCKRVLEAGPPGALTSHGACEACAAREFGYLGGSDER